MADPLRYYAQFQSARGGWASLPGWARNVVGLLAIPGLVLVALSILLLGVSILALLLLTVPAYRLLQALTGSRTSGPPVDPVMTNPFASLFGVMPGGDGGPSPGRRQVDVRVVDDGPTND